MNYPRFNYLGFGASVRIQFLNRRVDRKNKRKMFRTAIRDYNHRLRATNKIPVQVDSFNRSKPRAREHKGDIHHEEIL